MTAARFSRNREESILFKSLLRKHGVTVKSITENYDPETPHGFLYEGMIEVINQFYSMNLATETLKGMRENAERGFVNGGRIPYGYRLHKVGDAGGREHRKLVPGRPRRSPLAERSSTWRPTAVSAVVGPGSRRLAGPTGGTAPPRRTSSTRSTPGPTGHARDSRRPGPTSRLLGWDQSGTSHPEPPSTIVDHGEASEVVEWERTEGRN